MKTIIEVLKQEVAKKFEQEQFEVLSVSTGVSKDAENERDTPFVRLEVEVPRDLKPFGRCRFSVKIMNATAKVSQQLIDEGDSIYLASFSNLVLSYIDQKMNVYFRADSYNIEKGED